MRKAILRLSAGCLAVLTTLTGAGPARGDWPTARHDIRRTSVSTNGSNITKPGVYWKTRLGGAPGQVYVGDVDGDGAQDVLYLAGGELILAAPDGTVLWRTGSRAYASIAAVVDLNKDGQLDVIVMSALSASVVGGKSGKIEWEEPPTEIGTPNAPRIADLDGDGSPDLWLDTCGCCAVETGSPGVIYSFASGLSSPKPLGPPPQRVHCGTTSNTVGDFLGDGHLEMLSMSETSATLFRADGTVLGTSGAIPAHAPLALCQTANVDGQPGDEAVCFTNTVYGNGGERGVFALAYRPSESPPLKLLWNTTISPATGGDARAPTSLIVDLDGDGKLEAVVSGQTTGAYTTSILDAATGAVLVTTPGIAAGDMPASTSGQRWLLVSSDTAVTAMSFTRNPAGVSQVWQATGVSVKQRDWVRSLTAGLGTALVTPDLNGDAHPDLLLNSTTEPFVLTGYDVSQGAAKALGQYSLGAGVSLSAVGTSTGAVGPASLFVGRNDGFIALLDNTLTATNVSHLGAVTQPGMYVGSYYTGGGGLDGFGHPPIAGKMTAGDKVDAVLVVDSRGDLVRFDASQASNLVPAKEVWRLPDSVGAGMRSAGSVAAAIGVFRRRHPLTDPPQWVMAAIGTDGTELGAVPLSRPPNWDVLPGDFAGDGTVSFAGLDVDPAANTDITVMSASGQKVWQQSLVASAGTQPFAVADWDGDGADDVATVINVAHVFSGRSGAEIATGVDSLPYFTPIVASIDGSSNLDLLLQGGYLPVRALGHDLKTLWSTAAPGQPYPQGGLATCPSGAVLVEGTYAVPAQLTLTQASGATPATLTSVILASGTLYPDLSTAQAAKASLGQLTDVAISSNLDGTGTGPTALVGSTDGYLYAVDPCKGTLRWSVAFGYPVSSPVLADADGDGNDDVLVSVADGYLYDIRNEVLPAPDFVWDTDPPHGITSMDVDSITTTSTLYATWGAVMGASSYEVAVAAPDGTYLTSPTWIDVGAATSAPIPNLSLADGQRYKVGVRAVSPQGRSPDSTSNGVVVHLAGMVDGGTGGAGDVAVTGGCGCSVPGGGGTRLWAMGALAVLLAAGAARRRRRRS